MTKYARGGSCSPAEGTPVGLVRAAPGSLGRRRLRFHHRGPSRESDVALLHHLEVAKTFWAWRGEILNYATTGGASATPQTTLAGCQLDR